MAAVEPKAYDASRDHVFVCYAHQDRGRVLAEIQALREDGVNLWYDEGIEPGREWPEELAEAISGCTALLFFVSPASVQSRNCRNEVQYAREHSKPVVVVYLEETALPPSLQLTLATTHSLQRYALDPQAYRAQLVGALQQQAPVAARRSRFSMTPRQRERAVWTALIVAALAVVAWLAVRPVAPSGDADGVRFTVQVPAGLDITPQAYFEMFESPPLALSRDGRHMIFAARDAAGVSHLYWRALDRFEPVRVNGTQGASSPFFAWDGTEFGFVSGRALKKVPVQGGAAETIVRSLPNAGFGGASWGADGTIIYSPSAVAGLFRVPASGGTPEAVTVPDGEQGELSHVMPQWMPDQQHVLLSVRMGLMPESPLVQILHVETGVRRTVAEAAIGGRFSQGRLIYGGTAAASGSLWAVDVDAGGWQSAGEPVRLLESLATDLYALPFYDMAANGTMIYVPPSETPLDEMVWVDPDGESNVLATHAHNMLMPKISPDGRQVSVTLMDDVRAMGLWLLDPVRGTLVRFNSGGQNTHSAVWTPDGSALAFTSDHEGPSNLYLKPVDTGGPLRRLTTSEQHHDAGSFSPDGVWLTVSEMHPQSNWDIWLLHVESGEMRPFLRSSAEEMQGIVAPGGQWIAYTSNETGQREIYLERFPGGGGKRRVSVDGGEDSVWSRDGAHLYFRWRDEIFRVAMQGGDESLTGDPEVVWKGEFEGRAGYGTANWDVDAQGRLLLTSRQTAVLAQRINVVLGSLAETGE